MPAHDPKPVLEYWLDTVGPKGWYAVDETVDAEIRERFLALWECALRGGLETWQTGADQMLAYLIVTDQFPRNMFRGSRRAFATDPLAHAAASLAIHRKWDMRVPEPQRQFFYLPLMHSENLPDQDRCVRLLLTRMPKSGAENLLHARAHRDVIRRFGRFPYRNAALGRKSTPEEAAYIEAGGYAETMRQMQAAA